MSQDHIQGFMRIMPKWSTEQNKYVESGLFDIFIYETTANGEAVVNGTRKGKDGKEYPQYKIKAAYTVPISVLTKVISKEAFRAPIFQKQQRRQY